MIIRAWARLWRLYAEVRGKRLCWGMWPGSLHLSEPVNCGIAAVGKLFRLYDLYAVDRAHCA